MRKTILVLLAVFPLILGNAALSEARGGGHFGGGGGGRVAGGFERGGGFRGGGGGRVAGGFERGGGFRDGGFRGGGFRGGFRGDHFRGGHFRHGHGHFGVDVVVGPFGPWWWDPYPYPYYYPYQAPVVVETGPDVYIDPATSDQQYWYYCSDPAGYYPYVKGCPGGWMKVVPAPAPEE